MIGKILSVVKGVFVKALFFVVGGVLFNRLFLLFFGFRLWQFDWFVGGSLGWFVSLFVFLLFLIVFPLFFVWGAKWYMGIGGMKKLWSSYRPELSDLVVRRVVKIGMKKTSGLKEKGSGLLLKAESLYDEMPRVLKVVLRYGEKQLPLVEKLRTVAAEIDWEIMDDEEEIRSLMMEKLEPLLELEDEGGSSGLGWLFFVNVLCVVGVVVFIG